MSHSQARVRPHRRSKSHSQSASSSKALHEMCDETNHEEQGTQRKRFKISLLEDESEGKVFTFTRKITLSGLLHDRYSHFKVFSYFLILASMIFAPHTHHPTLLSSLSEYHPRDGGGLYNPPTGRPKLGEHSCSQLGREVSDKREIYSYLHIES